MKGLFSVNGWKNKQTWFFTHHHDRSYHIDALTEMVKKEFRDEDFLLHHEDDQKDIIHEKVVEYFIKDIQQTLQKYSSELDVFLRVSEDRLPDYIIGMIDFEQITKDIDVLQIAQDWAYHYMLEQYPSDKIAAQ